MLPSRKESENSFTDVRRELILWGSVTALTYAVFVVLFPLVPYIYRTGRMLDLEIILRERERSQALIYIFGLVLLFFSYWRIIRTLHRFSKVDPEKSRHLRIWVLIIGGVCGLILLGLYPITALDVSIYVVNARNWFLYGANPLLVPPGVFKFDPYAYLAGEYVDKTSPYGPLWELIARIPIQLGMSRIDTGILSMKFISWLAYMTMSFLIGWKSRQQSEKYSVREVTALAFFALNPLVQLEALGNGHNDMTMIVFMMCGLILWQRGKWAWATLALTLASLAKIPAVIIIPLFGLTVLQEATTPRERFLRGLGMAGIFLGVFLLSYRLMGPFPQVFSGIIGSFSKTSFSVAYATFVVLNEIAPALSAFILPNTRYVFMLIYAYLAFLIWRKKLTLVEAGFLAYFSFIFLINAFRLWYLLWLFPFAALNLNSRTFWRTFLFSLTVEFSILSYFLLWRWYWRDWTWGLTGPLAPYWDYFKIMTPFTVSWTFSLPFLGDLVGRLRDKKKFAEEFWI